jgi:uncharacterized protein (DUF433 family)
MISARDTPRSRAAGASIDDLLKWYEGLDRTQVQAVIEFAARSLDLAPTKR